MLKSIGVKRRRIKVDDNIENAEFSEKKNATLTLSWVVNERVGHINASQFTAWVVFILDAINQRLKS